MLCGQIETFGMLISRSYLCIITEDEKKVRDELAQTIRVCSSQHASLLLLMFLYLSLGRLRLPNAEAGRNDNRNQLVKVSSFQSL